MFGFDLMLRLLAKHQNVDEAIGDALIDLALDRDVSLNGGCYSRSTVASRSPSISRLDNPPHVPLIVHPEAIRLLLELLRLGSSRSALHLRYVERLSELVESRANLDTLLAQPWLNWARQYLEGIGRHRVITDVSSQVLYLSPLSLLLPHLSYAPSYRQKAAAPSATPIASVVSMATLPMSAFDIVSFLTSSAFCRRCWFAILPFEAAAQAGY
jgi:hypothetical protein